MNKLKTIQGQIKRTERAIQRLNTKLARLKTAESTEYIKETARKVAKWPKSMRQGIGVSFYDEKKSDEPQGD